MTDEAFMLGSSVICRSDVNSTRCPILSLVAACFRQQHPTSHLFDVHCEVLTAEGIQGITSYHEADEVTKSPYTVACTSCTDCEVNNLMDN